MKDLLEDAADFHFMDLALAQAQAALALGEVPIGAVVTCDGQLVAAAHNRRELDGDPAAHAELLAIRQAALQLGRWRLTDCTVYVTLEPCVMCAGLMVLSRVARCVYGASDPKSGALGTLYNMHNDTRLNHSFTVSPGVRERECATLLRDFFATLRRQPINPKEAG